MKRIAYTLLELLLLLPVMFGQCQNPESEMDREPAFHRILTGNTLENWEGNPEYWRFEDGILIGEITPQNILLENSFFIWKEEKVRDFELKVEYRISSDGNSGINYRSEKVEDTEYVLRGYQADIDGLNRYSGQIYEEKGRSILAARGQVALVSEENKISVIGSTGKDSLLSSVVNRDEWNDYHLIVRGNTFIHMINGRVMSIAIDEGGKQKEEGLLGLQLHRGPPMKVEFRNLQLKKFTNGPT